MEIVIREIKQEDLRNGFFETLDSLRMASDIDAEKAKKIFQEITSNPNHKIFVAIVNGKVVGTVSLIIEPKFIHNGGYVGHIEDVVITKDMQGTGIGEKMVKTALEYATTKGCYKTILDCGDDVKHFYEQIGFKRNSNSMRFDHC